MAGSKTKGVVPVDDITLSYVNEHNAGNKSYEVCVYAAHPDYVVLHVCTYSSLIFDGTVIKATLMYDVYPFLGLDKPYFLIH